MRFLALIVFAFLLAACAPHGSQTDLVEGNIDTCPSTTYAADIGNKVWLDENMDGVKQIDEPGLAGINVNLWIDNNSSSANKEKQLYKSTVTDKDGHYRFDAIDVKNDYLLEIELPLGYGFANKHSPEAKGKDWDSDINPQTGLSDSLSVEKGKYYYWIDAALVEDDLASVGDKVWIDDNKDGIKQNDESGFAEIKVNLWQVHDLDKSLDRIVATKTTNDAGNYRFSGLFPKLDYRLEFITPKGYEFSTQDNPKAPSYDEFESDWDSDVNPENGFSDVLELVANEYNYRVDAAMYELKKEKIEISLLPKHASLYSGQQSRFVAKVSGTENKAVVWKTTGGMISADGLYTAPKKVGQYIVSAFSAADKTVVAHATVDVVAKPEISISISPTYIELAFGEKQQFRAVVKGAENKELIWQASGGKIDSNGLFTAANKVGDYYVWARAQANNDIYARAQVKVYDPNSCKDPLRIDDNLAEALRVSLQYYENQTITCSDMLKISNLIASYAEIDDIDVLKYAKNLEILHLENNEIEDIDALKGLDKLQELDLSNNLLRGISPLIANHGLNDGDELNLENNCFDLDEESLVMHDIDTLEERGVNVSFGGDGDCDD